MTDIIVTAILVVILGSAAWYVCQAKKRGAKCIGCPVEGGCSGSCSSCGCHSKDL